MSFVICPFPTEVVIGFEGGEGQKEVESLVRVVRRLMRNGEPKRWHIYELRKYLSTWKALFTVSHLARGINLKSFALPLFAVDHQTVERKIRCEIDKQSCEIKAEKSAHTRKSGSNIFFLIFCLSLIETKNISAQIFVSRLRLSKPGTQAAVPLCTPMRRAVAVMLMLRKTALDGNFPQIALIKSSLSSDLFRFSRHVLACQREKLLDQLHLLARLHWH
jgi:hypothetical protein